MAALSISSGPAWMIELTWSILRKLLLQYDLGEITSVHHLWNMDHVPRIHLTVRRLYNYADWPSAQSLDDSQKMYLPIRIESVIPHDIAGTDAPLYNARGPCLSAAFFLGWFG